MTCSMGCHPLPGLRTVRRGPLMLVYLTGVRGERVVIIQVNWIG